jgi:hypothetical protein
MVASEVAILSGESRRPWTSLVQVVDVPAVDLVLDVRQF